MPNKKSCDEIMIKKILCNRVRRYQRAIRQKNSVHLELKKICILLSMHKTLFDKVNIVFQSVALFTIKFNTN